ncbi:bifunctional fructose-bisphosphatase/inositol-phosphate phosphatase [Brevibacterium daeguense]|uniref:Bifunctional fructose-bisphosphatase/inositol-phosphate phosphatase n=1 Tax=Brevibacterium daeguense TaxID=909936 RepID=A0ABP8EH42_9MICO|nr:inositol monophosphatase family protein [Brevibacterium daeguense]
MSAGDRGNPPHPVLAAAADAALGAYRDAIRRHTPAQLAEHVLDGADGTPSMHIDVLVEDAVIDAVTALGANVLSEERGWVDRSSALTVVIDPVDGTANAASGVPVSCFSGAVAVDGVFTHALTSWLHTDDRWWAQAGVPSYRTSGRRAAEGAAVSLLRPHDRNWEAWSRVARAAGRIRVLGCSTMDAALVATGAIDAFADAGSDTHRLMDLAAAAVLVPAAGGVLVDAHGRPFELDLDLTRRWSGVVAATPELADEMCALINLA